ncbi:MAG: hydantoinase/oxoprolinase family protein [Deltaproteobacteria bacterium]|nr:hydantoinase/oxoprolinase family protein [Deltaproteobacteria bacterium]
MRIGIDVGGTFTDVVMMDRNDRFFYVKTPTTHQDLAEGVLNGIDEVMRISHQSLRPMDTIIHGTTIGTNAIVEKKGAKVGLLTTKGFEDVLEIRRVARPTHAAYDFEVDNPPPLVPRYLRRGINERVNSKGDVVVPLDEDSARESVQFLKDLGIEAITISLLFSFLNPTHERKVAEICREIHPEARLSLSSEVCPEFREYERTCTTVMNSYLGPVIAKYMRNLIGRLHDKYHDVNVHIMQSNGGSMTVEMAETHAANLINSGPAAGAMATAFIADLFGSKLAVGADMGGTTFDISIIDGGVPRTTTWGGVTDYPIKLPMIDMRTIGAGGGSIAWVDELGVLNVGPQSAGSEPGPACYGKGGRLPTVTDANLVLRRLNPEFFNEGKQKLYPEKATEAIKVFIAERMDLSVEESALGIIKIVNANMAKGISASSVERGYDLREFILVTLGGACNLHAAEIAMELNIPKVIVPPMCGVLSALGLLVSDIQHDYVTTISKREQEITPNELQSHFQELEHAGIQQLRKEGARSEDIEVEWSADLRYDGQSWELNIPISKPSASGPLSMKEIKSNFHKAHHKAYSYYNSDEMIEFVNLRVRAKGNTPSVKLPRHAVALSPVEKARKEKRAIWLDTGPTEVQVYDRDLLGVETSFRGPCLIEEGVATTFVPLGCSCNVDEYMNLVITIQDSKETDSYS